MSEPAARPGVWYPLGATIRDGGTNFAVASSCAEGMLLCLSQDPVVSRAKPIAEPWDVGRTDSYEVGRFPPLWREWNGRYRDTVRDFWRSHDGLLGDFATRLTGSSDLYGGAGRRPTASVNLITADDGFTLADLVSYDGKHNEANGEDNRDGTDDNRSWNCGAEGPTADAEILALRGRQSRVFLTTLLLSFGVPMILGGDELGRTQEGNNNAYCQDDPVTWFDWSAVDQDLLAFSRRLVALRLSHPVLRRRRFLMVADGDELQWFTPAGVRMTVAAWMEPGARSITLYLDGTDAPDRAGQEWVKEIDTFDPGAVVPAEKLGAAEPVTVGPRSIVVLRGPVAR